jgi:transposase
VERFPTYAPELDPVEYLWSALKRKDLGNLDPDTFDVLPRHLARSRRRYRRHPEILRGFLRASGVFNRYGN